MDHNEFWIAVLGDKGADQLIAEFQLTAPTVEWVDAALVAARGEGLEIEDEAAARFVRLTADELDAVIAEGEAAS